MFLSNKVTGSVRGQYRHEVKPSEMHRDFIESKDLTNLVGCSNAKSRLWIRGSVEISLPGANFHILGKTVQPVGIFLVFGRKCIIWLTISEAPRNVLTAEMILQSTPFIFTIQSLVFSKLLKHLNVAVTFAIVYSPSVPYLGRNAFLEEQQHLQCKVLLYTTVPTHKSSWPPTNCSMSYCVQYCQFVIQPSRTSCECMSIE